MQCSRGFTGRLIAVWLLLNTLQEMFWKGQALSWDCQSSPALRYQGLNALERWEGPGNVVLSH